MKDFFYGCLTSLGRLVDHHWVTTALALLATLFAVQVTLVLGVFVMMTLDLVTGIYAATRRGERITSTAMRRTVPKFFTYALFLVAFVVLGNMIDQQWITEYAFALVGLTEAKSIVENTLGLDAAKKFIRAITGKYADGALSEVVEDDKTSE